jgi:cell shape-determining protein MreC
MNANELADELEKPNNWQQENNFTTRAATMLRQQQAEIEALKAENKFFKDLMSDVEILRKASEI